MTESEGNVAEDRKRLWFEFSSSGQSEHTSRSGSSASSKTGVSHLHHHFVASSVSMTPDDSSESIISEAASTAKGKAPTITTSAVELAARMKEQHERGECKPCIFFLKKSGCSNGDACSYCHLCRKTPTSRLGKIQRDRYNRIADNIVEKLKVAPPERHRELVQPVLEKGHVFLKNALLRRLGDFRELAAFLGDAQAASGSMGQAEPGLGTLTKYSL